MLSTLEVKFWGKKKLFKHLKNIKDYKDFSAVDFVENLNVPRDLTNQLSFEV